MLGAGRRCWCCELAVHLVETGCQCWCWVLAVRVVETGCRAPVPGAGAVLLFQTTMSWLRAGCRCWVPVQGAGAGCVAAADCSKLAVRVVETGCRCWVPVPGAGAGCGRVVETRRRCWALAVHVVESRRRRRCCELAVRVVETGRQCCVLAVRRVVETGCRVPGAGLGGGAGARCWCPLLIVKCAVEVPYSGCAGCVHSCSSQSRVNRSWDSA